jgi:hypothetical protein
MKYVFLTGLSFILILSQSCDDSTRDRTKAELNETEVAYSPEKDAQIQRKNLELRKKTAENRFPCDTVALKEFILNTFPKGTYLVDFDKTVIYDIPQSAVIYTDQGYIFAVIAKSGADDRLIEMKNIVGYDQSFIDLDSTELGTAFFYLTLLECSKNSFKVVWDSPIPSHGGFNKFSLEHWDDKNIPYVRANFHYARGIGHIDYNYFFVYGIREEPHLLMTYEGINFKRTITDYNDDQYPDYYEYIYYDTGDRVYAKDSVAFVWKLKEKVYVNTRNSRQTRQY